MRSYSPSANANKLDGAVRSSTGSVIAAGTSKLKAGASGGPAVVIPVTVGARALTETGKSTVGTDAYVNTEGSCWSILNPLLNCTFAALFSVVRYEFA